MKLHSRDQIFLFEIGKNRGDIGFIVGETDEEEEEVLFRLKDEDNRESLSDDAEPDIPVYISDESTSFLSDVDAEPPFSEESDLQSQTLSASVQVPSIEEDSAREPKCLFLYYACLYENMKKFTFLCVRVIIVRSV